VSSEANSAKEGLNQHMLRLSTTDARDFFNISIVYIVARYIVKLVLMKFHGSPRKPSLVLFIHSTGERKTSGQGYLFCVISWCITYHSPRFISLR